MQTVGIMSALRLSRHLWWAMARHLLLLGRPLAMLGCQESHEPHPAAGRARPTWRWLGKPLPLWAGTRWAYLCLCIWWKFLNEFLSPRGGRLIIMKTFSGVYRRVYMIFVVVFNFYFSATTTRTTWTNMVSLDRAACTVDPRVTHTPRIELRSTPMLKARATATLTMCTTMEDAIEEPQRFGIWDTLLVFSETSQYFHYQSVKILLNTLKRETVWCQCYCLSRPWIYKNLLKYFRVVTNLF